MPSYGRSTEVAPGLALLDASRTARPDLAASLARRRVHAAPIQRTPIETSRLIAPRVQTADAGLHKMGHSPAGLAVLPVPPVSGSAQSEALLGPAFSEPLL